MYTLRFVTLILALVSPTLTARDHVPREANSSLRSLEYNAVDNTVVSGSQQYAPNIGGLRQYLNQEVTPASRDYERLDSRLQELEKQDQMAFRTAMIPAGLGIGSILVGSFLRQDEEPTDAQLKSLHEKGGRLMLYGLGGLALGFMVHSMLAPDDHDVRQYIDYHNGQKTQSTPKNQGTSISLGLLERGSLVSISYKF